MHENNFSVLEDSLSFAQRLDGRDPLRSFREEFHIPPGPDGQPSLYLCGNSLGLQPKRAREYVLQELDDWARLGVEGHFDSKHPWLPYHENLTDSTARLMGAYPIEIVVMNTLSVNLHLMMASFYRPTSERFKILVEAGAFPSDQYAVASQARFHGYDPKSAILELKPRAGEATLRPEDILETIAREGKSVALILLGNVNYLTGQAFDMKAITAAGHAQGCRVGFDLAHGAGNLDTQLHASGADFAVWCSYKYLNGGPGTLSGCFVHERHARDSELPRFAGWWGHDKATRFKMGPDFHAIPGAEGWQLSNPPILQLAALRASMELFDRATISALRRKAELLTGYIEFLLRKLPSGFCEITTPQDLSQRGCQLSLRIKGATSSSASPLPGAARELSRDLAKKGIICDFREPDVVRVAPVPLYNRFEDVYRFATELRNHANV